MNAEEKAKTFGSSTGIESGINWTWAMFGKADDAREFEKWCRENGYETRGIYPDRKGGADVRFRR